MTARHMPPMHPDDIRALARELARELRAANDEAPWLDRAQARLADDDSTGDAKT